MITTPKWLGLLAVAFVAGSFIASPDLRAFAANTVFSGDIVDGEVKTADLGSNSVTAGKIKDGEVKAAEIATDAVGGAEIQGVTKLQFVQCAADSNEQSQNVDPTKFLNVVCTIAGVELGDSVVATKNSGNNCFEIERALPGTGTATVVLRNECTTQQHLGTPSSFSLVVFDK